MSYRRRNLVFGMLVSLLTAIVLLAGMASAAPARRAARLSHTQYATRLTWFGHAAFRLVTPSGKVLLIDPWITNPANPTGKADLAGIGKADLILVTHGHFDHVGDSAEIARRTGAQLIAVNELADAMVRYGGFPKEQASLATAGNSGGELTLLGGEVKVAFVPAVHSSGFAEPSGPNAGEVHYAGNPCGFLISVRGGPTIYHTGDTDFYSDMALIPKVHPVDVMLCCIGDRFTMGPDLAAKAVGVVKPSLTIPMHYGTFPLLTGTPAAFSKALRRDGVSSRLHVMHVHETLAL